MFAIHEQRHHEMNQNYHNFKLSANRHLFAIIATLFLFFKCIFLIIRNCSVNLSHTLSNSALIAAIEGFWAPPMLNQLSGRASFAEEKIICFIALTS